MCFNNNTLSIKTEHDPRKLINGIQQATLFEQFLALARFSPILPIHDLSSINWDCTWFCLGNDVETPSCHTSFTHNSTFSWASKLLLDELPLLSKLQLRRPDLYLAEWNCVSCGLAPETWSHFWSCPTILPKLVGLKEAIKQALINILTSHDRSPSDGLSATMLFDIDNLDCWLTQPSILSSLHFDLLIRGFVPSSLFQVVKSVSSPPASDSASITTSPTS